MQDSWSQLSVSSRRALQWAWALACFRAEQAGEDPSSAEADSFDFLVGMLLEHPKDAEAKVLLDHFGLVPGQLLPPGYSRPAPPALERLLRATRGDGPPPMDGELSMIVERGTSIGLSSGNPDVAELRAFFAAMLQLTNPVSSALDGLLAQRGVTLGIVSEDVLKHVGSPERASFAAFLRERHPFSLRPIDIPNYKADHGQQTGLDQDMVGIRAEVDAFAYLLASRGLKPPLAVGLFGDWGSGKSFFMESVRLRIDQLTGDPRIADRPQSQVPFWKRIVQVQFNAWHYVEGELWASLVDHIFNQLRLRGDTDDLVARRRAHWLEKLDHTHARLARLELKRSETARELEDKQAQAEMLRRQRDSDLAKLERLKGAATKDVVIESSVAEVKAALEPFMISIGVPRAEEVFGKLDEARAELRRGRTLVESLWESPAERRFIVAALVGVPAFVWALSLVDTSAIATAFGGVSAAAAAVLTGLGRATSLVRGRLGRLEAAERQVRDEIESVRAGLNQEIGTVERNIDDAEKRLKAIVETQQSLSSELNDIQQKLKEITPARVLTEFVAERVGSGDYRKHLGVPALIQQDFRQLANLIAQQNAAILEDESGSLEKHDDCFNRIILYIDDLDRCPDDRVIAVLQAVHLLLAFELFVVVVAVDSRWLCHALTKQFKALAPDRETGGEATPDDYLEKIFQIPFCVQPLGEGARRNIVQNLLRGHLRSPAGQGSESEAGDRPTVGEEQHRVLAALDPAGAPPNLEAAALAITHAELRFLDELAPLLGATPRSTKRFVNIYQLVRVIYRTDPEGATGIEPPDHELVPFVLALGEGLPTLGPALLEEASRGGENDNLDMLLQRAEPDADTAEAGRLRAWIDARPHWKQIPVSRVADAFRKVDRFLFRVGALSSRRAAHGPPRP